MDRSVWRLSCFSPHKPAKVLPVKLTFRLKGLARRARLNFGSGHVRAPPHPEPAPATGLDNDNASRLIEINRLAHCSSLMFVNVICRVRPDHCNQTRTSINWHAGSFGPHHTLAAG